MLARKFVRSLLNSDDPAAAFFSQNVDPKLFRGEEADLYQMVAGHIGKYGKVPGKDLIEKECGVMLGNANEPTAYYHDELKKRHIHLELKQALLDSGDMLNSQEPYKALQRLVDASLTLTTDAHKNRIVSYSKDAQGIIFNELKKKLLQGDDYGIKFGWKYLDDMTGGLIGGDVASIVGRPASGKTYMMLYAALNAWYSKKVPLVVSMEMKPLPIIQRLTAIDTSTSISELKNAELSSNKSKEIVTKLTHNASKQDFWVIDGALASTLDDLVMYCHQFRPDVIFIDGAYLVRSSNPRMARWERVTENAERFKSDIAEALDIPAVISYQFNRKATEKKEGAPGVENIAYTDAIGQVSSVVLGLMQPESVETLMSRVIQILKGRNGEVGEFTINWQFDSPGPNYMDFSQINTNVGELQFI